MTATARVAPRHESMATEVAAAIRVEIMKLGWPTGHRLGAEADLLDRFGVSRAVLREAIAILELTDTVTVRRGVAGGIEVHDRADHALVRTIGSYLDYAGVDLAELLEARFALETLAARTAAVHRDANDLALLRSLPHRYDPRDSGFAFHVEIGRCSHNSLLAIFIEALLEATTARLRELDDVPRELLDHADHDHDAIIQAIARRHSKRAETLMAQHLSETSLWMTQFSASAPVTRHPRRPLRLASPVNGIKRHEQLARRITHDIKTRGLVAGTLLGSETDLVDAYAVSRGAFREAARVLSRFGILELRRGPSGGVFVGSPDPTVVIDESLAVLDFLDSGSDASYVQEALALTDTSLAADRCNETDAAMLRSVLAEVRSSIPVAVRRRNVIDPTAIPRAIAAATHNRALELLTGIVVAMQPTESVVGRTVGERQQVLENLVAGHERIVDAIASNDGPGALREVRVGTRSRASVVGTRLT